jgi:para-nitrobenzyl esterase
MKPYADALYAKGANVYGYYFDYVLPQAAKKGFGASHSDEIAYVFGNLAKTASSAQKALSKNMQAHWVNFIKYGDPNGPEDAESTWGKYNPNDFKVMIFRQNPVFATHPLKDEVGFMENIMFGPKAALWR